MKAIGLFFILFGWLSSISGYGINQVVMILVGIGMYTGGIYFGRR